MKNQCSRPLNSATAQNVFFFTSLQTLLINYRACIIKGNSLLPLFALVCLLRHLLNQLRVQKIDEGTRRQTTTQNIMPIATFEFSIFVRVFEALSFIFLFYFSYYVAWFYALWETLEISVNTSEIILRFATSHRLRRIFQITHIEFTALNHFFVVDIICAIFFLFHNVFSLLHNILLWMKSHSNKIMARPRTLINLQVKRPLDYLINQTSLLSRSNSDE